VTEPQRITLPGVDDDTNRLLRHLTAELEAKQERNLLRAAYYDGKRAIRQVGSVIPPQYYRIGVVLGWSAKAVDLLARRCNLERFVWPDGNLDDAGLTELATANRLKSRINSALVSSLQHGPVFLINTVGDVAAGEPESLIHVKDALSATGDWNARRQRLDNLLSVTSRDDEGRIDGLALYLDGETITAERAAGVWSVDRQPHAWGVPAEVLAYKPDERRPLGRSRISRAIMSHHDAALRTLIRMEGHADVYSFPEMWMLGADESIFKNPDGSPKASWQVMLGRIKGIPDDEDATNPRATVQQFAAASPEPHLAQLNAIAKIFAREASLPDTAVAITDVANPTSAEAYDASQNELIAEAEGATDDWAPPLQRAVARGLAILNKDPGLMDDLAGLEVDWRNPRFLSRAAQADAGQKQLAAIPWLAETEVGLELLGLSEQQIRRALADRRRNNGAAVLRGIAQEAQAADLAAVRNRTAEQ
jgi:hypothetical protein